MWGKKVTLLYFHPEPYGFLWNVAKCKLHFFSSKIKEKTEVGWLPFGMIREAGMWEALQNFPSQHCLFCQQCKPSCTHHNRKREFGNLGSKWFLVFWDWHYLTFPTHLCKHHFGKALQEQRFRRPHMKAVSWWVPQCARGRCCTCLSFCCCGIGDPCKIFVKKMLHLETNSWAAGSEHVNAFGPMER